MESQRIVVPQRLVVPRPAAGGAAPASGPPRAVVGPRIARLWLAAALALAACGDDGGGAGRDAGPGDAGPPVCPAAALPDGSCASERDCGPGAACVARAAGEGDPAALVPRCGPPAGAGLPGDPCEGPGDCRAALCAFGGTCLTPCAVDTDCPGVARCRAVDVRWQGDAAGAVRACAPWFVLPTALDPDTAVETRIGALRPGDAPATLGIPDVDALGLAVVEDRCGGRPLPRGLVALRAPQVTLYDVDRAGIGDPPQPNPVDRTHPAVVAVPSAERALGAAWRAPVYGLLLDVEADADADVAALAWSPAAGTRLDLVLFYVGPDDLAPEGARGPPAVAAALAEAEALLAPAGITFGRVAQHRVGGALAETLGVVELEPGGLRPDLDRLFRLSVGVRGVPVFLVRQLEGGPVGLAGGVPAPMGLPGTPGSGLALAYDVLAAGGGAGELTLGRTLAHELGHYLGLWHTTERVGVVIDPIEDTPICPIGLDGSAGTEPDGVLDAAECSGGFGAENLMFHTASGTELTPGQATVLGRGPLVY